MLDKGIAFIPGSMHPPHATQKWKRSPPTGAKEVEGASTGLVLENLGGERKGDDGMITYIGLTPKRKPQAS